MVVAVGEVMSRPPVTCATDWSLEAASVAMDRSGIGSLVVTEGRRVVGILTERDLLRASAAGADLHGETVARWMTADPDVLAPAQDLDDALTGLAHHRYRHLPVVDGGDVVGVVSLRDLLPLSHLRTAPDADRGGDAPAGLEGVVVARTAIGDVRGEEGFFHYRQYSATDLAAARSFESVWALLFDGALPPTGRRAALADEAAGGRELTPALTGLLPTLARSGGPLDALRSAVSVLGAELGWRPTLDTDATTLRAEAVHLVAVVPTILTALHRTAAGLEPVPPRPDLSFAANYLWMLHGAEATPEQVRAIEQYLILTIDHGFNASTFTARVITSTGADLAAAVVGAVGALSGPLHGGAPSRALAMLDAIGTPDRADPWIRDAVERGDRIMGFGHRVYKTDDPRSVFLRRVARGLGGDMAGFAARVEQTSVDVLAELKPGRRLYTNVEFYAGVVMDACGIPREMFTPTFACSRMVGWCAHVMEQAAANRLIRPAARYEGPTPPAAVPPE